MPAWGSLGGGPLSDQQLLDVIAYLRSIQLPANQATQAAHHRDQPRSASPTTPTAARCTAPSQDAATGRRSARRCSTWASTTASPAAPTRAPAATPKGWSIGMPQRVRWRRRPRSEPHQRQRAAHLRHRRRPGGLRHASARSRARATATAAWAAGRCRPGASTPTAAIPPNATDEPGPGDVHRRIRSTAIVDLRAGPVTMSSLHLLAGIDFNTGIRGILVVTLAIVVLPGSVYLLLATNMGSRLGPARGAGRPSSAGAAS